jgi:hypothetical protein
LHYQDFRRDVSDDRLCRDQTYTDIIKLQSSGSNTITDNTYQSLAQGKDKVIIRACSEGVESSSTVQQYEVGAFVASEEVYVSE